MLLYNIVTLIIFIREAMWLFLLMQRKLLIMLNMLFLPENLKHGRKDTNRNDF